MRKLMMTMMMIASASTLLAQNARPDLPKISKECRAQVLALCPMNGDPRAHHDCMVLNHDKISDDCKAQIKARHQAMHAWRMEHPQSMSPQTGAEPAPMTGAPANPPAL